MSCLPTYLIGVVEETFRLGGVVASHNVRLAFLGHAILA